MNLLIVDDEVYVVRAIRSRIDWNSLGIDEVFVAFNARKAKDVLRENKIDIIVTDIEMPQESGLELMQWVRDQGYPVKAVCLTCHAEFDYALEAMHLGVAEYCVKPIDFAAFSKVIARIVKEIAQEKEAALLKSRGELWENNREIIVRHFWEQVLWGDLKGRPEEIWALASKNKIEYDFEMPYRLLVCDVRKIYDRAQMWEDNRTLMQYIISNIAWEMLMHQKNKGRSGWNQKYFWVILDGNVPLTETTNELSEFIHTCHHTVGAGLAVYISSDVFGESLGTAWDEACEADGQNITCQEGVIRVDGSFHEAKTIAVSLTFEEFNEKIYRFLEQGDFGGFTDFITSYLLNAGSVEKKVLENLIQNIDQVINAFLFAHRIPVTRMDCMRQAAYNQKASCSVEDACTWLRLAAEDLGRLFESAEKENEVIRQIKVYIQDHIETKLSREDIAEAVYLSPGYMTRLFKKETGMTLLDYIISRKIKHAKMLLEQGDISVGDVSSTLGYENFSHFSELFKRHVGCSPSEYKRKMSQKP